MDDIDGLAASGSLPRTLAAPLEAKLRAVIGALDRHQASVAINVLQAFVHEVEAQVRAGRLTPQVGSELARQTCMVILALYGTC